MELPDYYQPHPPMDLDPSTRDAFERLYTKTIEQGTGLEIDYTLDAPKWQFLCYLADNKALLLHGSGSPNIEEFEPRQSNDTDEFGNRKAVYAASDGIWPMYFAIANRDGPVTSLINACFRVIAPDGSRSEPYYYFSLNSGAKALGAWRHGTIYILPRDSFEQQALTNEGPLIIEIAQWASLVAVRPLAKISVEPEDFPFLSRVRWHSPALVSERVARNPEGFPWLED